MNRCFSSLALLLVTCLGCHDAATQQKINQDRRSAISAELKAQGEAMHKQQLNDSDAGATQ